MNSENILEKELEKGTLYQLFVSLDLTKIDELRENATTIKEQNFYNKLYELALQTQQVELIEKGVF